MALTTFRRFPTEEEREAVSTLLEQHGIPVVYDAVVAPLSSTFLGQSFDVPYILKISATDFSKAQDILQEAAREAVNNVEPGYYLLSFNNEELLEIVHNPSDWGEFDYQLALKLLDERSVNINEKQLAKIHRSEQEKVKQAIAAPVPWTLLCFVIVFSFPFAIYYGFPADLALIVPLGTALYYLFAKNTLKDGSKVKSFDLKTRVLGGILLVTEIIIFAVTLIWLALYY